MVLNLKIGNPPESYTTLLGSLVRHVDVGSGLNITCAVVNYPLKLEYIIFYHNNKVNNVKICSGTTFIFMIIIVILVERQKVLI